MDINYRKRNETYPTEFLSVNYFFPSILIVYTSIDNTKYLRKLYIYIYIMSVPRNLILHRAEQKQTINTKLIS